MSGRSGGELQRRTTPVVQYRNAYTLNEPEKGESKSLLWVRADTVLVVVYSRSDAPKRSSYVQSRSQGGKRFSARVE